MAPPINPPHDPRCRAFLTRLAPGIGAAIAGVTGRMAAHINEVEMRRVNARLAGFPV